MKQEDLHIFERFDSVWQRVSNSRSATPEQGAMPPADGSEALMTELAALFSAYRGYAGRTLGEISGALLAMAEETKRCFRRLQLEYFLRTGDTYAPAETPLEEIGLASGLRRLYHRESALAERLAHRQDDPYSACRETAESHREKLRSLLGQLLE